MSPDELKSRIPKSAFAFRGYNLTNLGRSQELLDHSIYGATVRRCLTEASHVCGDVIGKRVDLVQRVKRQRQTTLRTYAEAVALILALEEAQLLLLEDFFGIDFRDSKYTYGYSLGEIAAMSASGVFDLHDAMRVPLALAKDCAELAEDVVLGILFSRGQTLPVSDIKRLCDEISQRGGGVVDISAYLSPNSLLIMGQGNTIDTLKRACRENISSRVNLRKTGGKFPPLHTSITWQRAIPNRAGVMMQQLPGGFETPRPTVLSLVTGKPAYQPGEARRILQDWVDHPQRLWDVVYETLTSGIDTVVHVGPEPNIIPATFKRLHDNVEAETKGRIGMRALKAVVRHPWLQSLLPQRTALLRATEIEHVTLEEWLLQNSPD